MKNLFTISIVLLLPVILFSQTDYRVIKVNGTITIESSGKNLATGLTFSDKENLLFKQSTAQAAVINGQKGRFVITPSNKEDLMASKSNYIPGLSNISSRAGSSSSLKNVVDIKNYFFGKFVIFDMTRIVISSDDYPMNEVNYFYLRYKYNNENIPKKLTLSGDTIIIDRNSLLSIDGNPISANEVTEISLMYFNGEKKTSTFITSFEPVFTDDAVKEEIKVILDEMKNETYSKKFDSIIAYLNEFYGKPDKENLKEWLKVNFGLK
ncbi:MAG: hypothetical protein A2W91_04180 [Bacteroidetes bacterium GWF2_38_335]|nr:MAG: hypothetical protein A2W91_04180 [Bacteroidetes bacterium GWF2_38_335]OFY79148.1 MAG: hypothetical protein A2281_03515 [Bacteroidetes bacterium RIFOXYA12_FULL_38_20]HBS88764.1 hypothetical protein [Bacteroidales bacterium]